MARVFVMRSALVMAVRIFSNRQFRGMRMLVRSVLPLFRGLLRRLLLVMLVMVVFHKIRL